MKACDEREIGTTSAGWIRIGEGEETSCELWQFWTEMSGVVERGTSAAENGRGVELQVYQRPTPSHGMLIAKHKIRRL